MKKTALLFFTLWLTAALSVTAQSRAEFLNGKIGITFSSFGTNDVARLRPVTDDTGYHSDKFYTLGFTYLYQLNHTFEVETGIEYSKHQILISVIMPPPTVHSPYSASFSLINIPVTLRANFLNYFFANGGIFIDADAGTSHPIDSQTGIGALLGVGMKYDFANGLSAFVNPYSKMHALLSFSSNQYPQKVIESGIRLGVMMKLN